MLRSAAAVVMLTATSICPCHAQEAGRVAVVPNMVIYPGETIRPEAIREVVLNENLYRNATAASAQEVLGKIAVVTLIPNEPIQPRMLRRPAAVQIGAIVSIRYELPGLSISASGTALQAGAIGERIRVKNLDSSAVLVGTVVDGGAVQVTD